MVDVLQNLIELLELEPIGEDHFLGQSQDLGFPAVFGGQVMGQALSAAKQTVPAERLVHSFHCYFLRPGDQLLPIEYEVDRIRDGKSFTTRRVVATQKGRAIFNLSASFQLAEAGFSHQDKMPDVEGPEGLQSDLEQARALARFIPERIRDKFTCDRPIEMRSVNPMNPLKPEAWEPKRYAWMRTSAPLPPGSLANKYLLAYASDYNFLITGLYPHKRTYWSPGMQVATIDHAMWFHRDFRFDDWLLYAVDSPSASNGRALVRGQIFKRTGELVASTIQEGLIRQHRQ